MRSGGTPGEARGGQGGGPGGARGRIPKRCDAIIFPGGSRGTLSDPIFRKKNVGGPKSTKNAIDNSSENRYWKIWEIIRKGSQNGAQNDPKTHRKSITKQVAKKEKKIVSIHVFVKGQTTLKYRKGHQFRGFRTMSMRTRKV